MNKRRLSALFVTATVTAVAVATVMLSPPAIAVDDTTPPSVPGTPIAATVTNTSITLVWAPATDDAGVSGYEIWRSPGSPINFVLAGTSSTPRFTDTGLSPGTIYLYRVRAGDAAGNQSALSPITPAMTAGPCTTPPPAPGNLTPVSIAPNAVTIRWGIVVPGLGCSPAGFDILRAPGAGGDTFTVIARIGFTNTFTDTTVTPATTYRYQVRARSANDLVSGPSNTLPVTTPPACSSTLPMGNLRITATSTSSVTLAWTGPTNPACYAYDILRAPGAGTTFTVVGTTTGLTFTNTGLTPSTTYRYLVRGRILPTNTMLGTIGPVVATTAQGCLLIPPPAPGNLTATNITTTSATLTWFVTAAPGCALTYEILRAPGTGGQYTPAGTSRGNTFTDNGLTPGTTYRYQARTRDADGNLSTLSNTVTLTTQ